MGLFEHAKRSNAHHGKDCYHPSDDEEGGAVVVLFGGRISVRCRLAIAPVGGSHSPQVVPDTRHGREEATEGERGDAGEEVDEAHGVEYCPCPDSEAVFYNGHLDSAGTDEGDEAHERKTDREDETPRAEGLIGAC